MGAPGVFPYATTLNQVTVESNTISFVTAPDAVEIRLQPPNRVSPDPLNFFLRNPCSHMLWPLQVTVGDTFEVVCIATAGGSAVTGVAVNLVVSTQQSFLSGMESATYIFEDMFSSSALPDDVSQQARDLGSKPGKRKQALVDPEA